MPKIAHTLRRGRTYYVRQRIPTDLLKSYDGKKEIVRSLGTDDPAQARKKVKIALLHIESEFEQKRRTNLPSAKGRKLDDLSDIEIVSMVIRWHQEHDKSNEETFLSESRPSDYQREEIIQTLLEEIGEEQRLLVEGTHYTKPIENLLQDKGIEFDSKSVAYSRLEDLLSRASIDLVTRTLQRYQGQAIIGINDPVFTQRPLYTAANSVIIELRKDIILAGGIRNALGTGEGTAGEVKIAVTDNEFPGTREKLSSFTSSDGITQIDIYAPVSADFLEAMQNENNEDFAFGVARRCVGMTKEEFRNLNVPDTTKIMQTVAKSFHLFRPT